MGKKNTPKWREVEDRGKGQERVTEVARIQENGTQINRQRVWLREQRSRNNKERKKKRDVSMKRGG